MQADKIKSAQTWKARTTARVLVAFIGTVDDDVTLKNGVDALAAVGALQLKLAGAVALL